MINISKDNGREQYVTEYIADTAEDIANLPTYCTVGSTCFVIATSQVYMFNSNKQWVEI